MGTDAFTCQGVVASRGAAFPLMRSEIPAMDMGSGNPGARPRVSAVRLVPYTVTNPPGVRSFE
jgi:hypothetical protein